MRHSTSILITLCIICITSFTLIYAENLYDILELSQDATTTEIKKSFRKLSLKYHPDKNPDNPEVMAKFQAVNRANEILSDPDKRQTYDLHGEEGLEQEQKRAQQGGGGGGIWDLFGMGGQQQQGGKRKGPDFRMDFPVTLEELYNGAAKTFSLQRRVVCKSCKGSGAKGGETKKCPACNGQGSRMTLQQLGPGFNVQMQTQCDRCAGKGKIPKSVCPVCGGSKLQKEEKQLEAVVERGMPNAHELVFERASEQSPDTVPGDVILTLRTQEHSRFKRHGNDLHMDHVITLKEALLGFSTTVQQLDGRPIMIKQEGVTSHEFVRVIKGEGMPHHNFPSDKGDLHVKFTVKFPKTLTQQQQEGVRALLSE